MATALTMRPSLARRAGCEPAPPPIDRAIPIRATSLAAGMGSLLTLANQAGALFGTAAIDWLALAQVYLTPFIVVWTSQVLAIRQAAADARAGVVGPRAGRFLETLAGHGIPRRAVALGLVMGTANTLIAIAGSAAGAGQPDALPAGLIVQAFTLPVLFSMVSQTIAYRRADVTPPPPARRASGGPVR